MKLLLVYFFVALLGLALNGVGVVGYYRLFEYLPFFCALVMLDRVLIKEGLESAVNIFSKWVYLAAWMTLVVVVIGAIFSFEHFYALETQGRYRLGGDAYSPNYLGMVFVAGILSAIYLYGQTASQVRRFLLVVNCCLFVVVLYLTGSRTAQFSLIAALGWWWYVKRTQLVRMTLVVTVLFVIAPVLVLFLQFLMEELLPLIGRGERPLYDLLTLNNRSVVAEVGLKGAFEHWGIGVGFVEGVKEYYRNNFTQSYWLPPHSHNALIEVFLSSGLFALLIMLFPFFLVVKSGVKQTFNPGATHYKYLVALSIPLLLGCATMTIFGGVYTVLTFWFFSVALLVGRGR
ncbi:MULTISPECIES: O-antigen ligase family protein [unclassified Pseudomonas]|uniref:O-antigen ligase family protein n=1 Tax=unclassified Pseudomonas TaxID=196821 RepID=UPI0021BBB569|nr:MULTISPECIES: O-antigen ligase family protein [unclassified Pseudomonas]MCT8166639.1 O-antigen ligase family protein [Pseudomonas sp. HD6422]MCT8185535.1 O-antigen ligase family protein [Pseudomonas sp. HD6421]